MDKARKLRGTTKSSFTKTYNKIDELLTQEDKNIIEINVLFGLLEKKYEEILIQDNQILNLLLDTDGTQAELDDEQDTADKYVLKYNRIKTAVSKLGEDRRSVAAESDRSFAQSNNNNPKRSFKLPHLELKKFSGDIKEWLQFWTQFRKIDEDESIEAGDKFQYLIQATVAGSKARELVESFPATEGNYNTLSTNTTPLVSLYDKLECHLRALETLDVTTEKCASMLLPLVESCLPEDVLRMWQRNSTVMSVVQSQAITRNEEDYLSNTSNTSKDRLDQLMKFIAAEVVNEQKVTLAKTGFGDMTKQRFKKKEHSFKQSYSITEELPTAAGLLTTTKEQMNGCVFCNGSHKATDCFKAQSMKLEEKRKILETKKCCYICFRPGHPARVCRNKQRCIICRKGHNVLMCYNLSQTHKEKQVNTSTPQNKSEDKKTQLHLEDNTLATVTGLY